jgi:lipopolysaccharide transport system permease protein
LGTGWIVVSPLLSAFLFTFVFGRVAHLQSEGFPYFAFSYAGLLAWNLFSGALNGAASSLNSNSTLISKIYFPRLVLPVSTLASTLINTAISIAVMCVLLIGYGIGFSPHLVLLPLWLVLAIVLAVGVGLILTSISVTHRDVNQATPALLSLFLYLTPVAYSLNAVPHSLHLVYRLNPASTIVEGCRWSLLGQGTVAPWAVLYTAAFTIVVLLVGMVLFTRLERTYADVI